MNSERRQQLLDLSTDGGDAAEIATADLFAEFDDNRPDPGYPKGAPSPCPAESDNPQGPGPAGLSEIPEIPDGDFPLALDFETYYDKDCTVSEMGYWRYAHHPKFRVLLVGYAYRQPGGDIHCGAVDPRIFPWGSITGRQVLAHNAAFDMAVYSRLAEDGTAPAGYEPREWIDTAAMSRYFQCPGDLAGAALAILGTVVDKAPRDNAKGATMATPEYARYCAQDARLCLELWESAGKYWPTAERRISALTMEIGRRGIAVDPAAWRTLGKLTGDLETLDASFPWSGTAPPTSPKALKDYCALKGFEPPESTDIKSPKFITWAANSRGEIRDLVGKMQTRRRLNRRISVLRAMYNRTFPTQPAGERLETYLKYCGAAPGRWSGGGRGWNPQNINSDGEFCDVRGFLVPAPGKVFGVIDLAQIEARILLWLAGDHDTLDRIRAGLGVYEAHARATMHWTGGDLKSENPRLYKLAKARVLGLGYGCGAGKFAVVAKAMAGLDLDPKLAASIVRDYRKTNAPICAYWDKLESECMAAAGTPSLTFASVLPSGRQILYRNVKVTDKGPDKKPELTAEQIKGERPVRLWGAILAENAVQGTARDVFADRLLALSASAFRAVLLVHDEYVLELDQDRAPQLLETAMAIVRKTPEWAADLPLDCEGKLMERYAK